MTISGISGPGQVHYEGDNSHDSLSPAIWSRVSIPADPRGGFTFFDNFHSFAGAVSTNVGTYNGAAGAYRSYEDTGGSIAQLATNRNGVVRLTTDGTDNDEVWIQPGGATTVLGAVGSSFANGNTLPLLFETRFKISQITSGNLFLGLSEEGLAAADTITDAGALASKDFLGFAMLEDAAATLKFIFRKAGGAAVTVATVKTLVEDTWYKVGFAFDPNGLAANKITIYLDGVDIGTYVTSTQLALATFPLDEELNILAGVKNSAAAALALDLDWVGFHQDR